MSVALRQFESVISEVTRGLSDEETARITQALMANPILNDYYSQTGKLFVTDGDEVAGILPCERVAFEYPRKNPKDPSQWQNRARGQATMGRTRDGDLWAHMKGGPLFHSRNGGRTWTWSPGSSFTASDDFTFTVLDDDTFLVVGGAADQGSLMVHHSKDKGKTWGHIASIEAPSPYRVIGDDTPGMTQLSDGTIVFTTQAHTGQGPRRSLGHLLCRSQDAGKTWSLNEIAWKAHRVTRGRPEFPAHEEDPTVLRPLSGESHILELRPGRLLHTIRWQLVGTVEVDISGWEDVSKTVCFLDSDDDGLTWKHARPTLDADGELVLVYGECHGQTAQMPDGRIVLVHDHRYPYGQGEIIAHVSSDEGRTWDRRAYHVSFGMGYPAIVALEDGTIVTVAGAALHDENGQPRTSRHLWTSVATRWRLPPP